MSVPSKLTIDLKEEFDHLPNAPIVEGVIHWRAAAEKKWEPGELEDVLKSRLPEYPDPKQQRELSLGGRIGERGSTVHQRRKWHGLRFESKDKRHIVQFQRDGLIFSRLKPYPEWSTFEEEALKFWEIHKELFEPSQLDRLGVRFINLIESVTIAEAHNYLVSPPKCPDSLSLPFFEFLQQYTFDVPGYPYKAQIVQTVQPKSAASSGHPGLILDIDVFTTDPQPIPCDNLKNQLAELRWLKNKLFFGSLRPGIIDRFKGSSK